MKNGDAAEFGQGFLDAAAGPQQQPAFVGNHDLRTLARREMLLHLFGEVVHIDHSLLDAGVGEPVEHMIDQRPARDLDQRFRVEFVRGRIRVPSPAAGPWRGGERRVSVLRTWSDFHWGHWRDTRPRVRPVPDGTASVAGRSIHAADDASIAVCGRGVRAGQKSQDFRCALRGERRV